MHARGNKNAATKMLPACLLTDQPVLLHNVPDIVDVRVVIELMQHLGAEVDWTGPSTLRVHARHVASSRLDPDLASRIRASVVFAGALLARKGEALLPMPGGDLIGERRLDTHLAALRQLGVDVDFDGQALHFQANTLSGDDILLAEASVTATENLILTSVLARGTTVLRNAAGEPHIQDLCRMLNGLGARISGAGSNCLVIHGVDRLAGGEARVGADFMEVGSYVGAAVVTGGELLIQDADPYYLEMVAKVFQRLGVRWEVRGRDIFVSERQSLSVIPDLGERIPVIKAQPWPGFPPDLMSIALVIATCSAGTVLFHDWMYESRFFFADNLVRMGARITLLDPHRVLVQGPTTFHAVDYISSPDIRAGMAMLLAALSARGVTRIANIQQIDRGYERVEETLNGLGARIVRITDDAVLQSPPDAHPTA